MSKNSSLSFAFGKKNFLFVLGGLAVVLIGFMLMSGGGSPDPNVFNADELFSNRRITLAPIVVLIGYVIIGYGIMLNPNKKES
jgi:hypothetical protein